MPKKRHHSPYVTQAFKPSAWLANIDFVKRLISTSHLLMVVMSEALGGKSTFIDLLRLKLDPSIQTILLHSEEIIDETSFTHALSPLLNVPQTDPPLSCEGLFHQLDTPTKPILIIVDDAQALSFDFLKQLIHAYKKEGANKRLHLCLVSDFSLTPSLHKLEQDGFKHFIHTIEPGSLTEAEAKTYVLKYFQGRKGIESLFHPGRFKSFHTMTQGQIAAINQHLTVFLEQQLQRRAQLGTMLKKLTVLPLILIGFLLSVGGGMHWLHHRHLADAKFIALIPPHQSTLYPSEIAPWYAQAKRERIEPPPLNKYVDVVVEEEAEQINQDLVVLDKVVVIPTVPKMRVLSSLPPVPRFSQASLSTQHGHSCQPGKLSGCVREDGAAHFYTIQLMAARNKSILKEAIQHYHLDASMVSIHQAKQSPWLVLTMGVYPKLMDANLALKNLSPSLKTLQPWIRNSDQLV